jgi:hypothetical protein
MELGSPYASIDADEGMLPFSPKKGAWAIWETRISHLAYK